MSTTAHSPPLSKPTFLDLPPETRVMIYKLTCSTFTVHVRPRFLAPDRQLLEQPTIVTLTNCNILSLSKQIRNEALPYVQISPTIQICRSAVVEIHQAVARRPGDSGHSETTCHFLSHISPTPCDLHQTPNFSLCISDHAAIANYFILGFHAAQETDCRMMTKKWLRVIEPHIYHDHLSMPAWWPENVAYTEDLGNDGESPLYDPPRPDIWRAERTDADRIHLLTHILLTAGRDAPADPPERNHGCSVADLELCAWRHVSEMQNPNTPELLEEMFRVRQLMERMGIGESTEAILSGLVFSGRAFCKDGAV